MANMPTHLIPAAPNLQTPLPTESDRISQYRTSRYLGATDAAAGGRVFGRVGNVTFQVA